MKTVLVLEGNEQDHRALQALLQDHGYTVNQTSGKTLQTSEMSKGADPRNQPGVANAPLATFRSSLDGKLYAVALAADNAFEVTDPPRGVERHFRGIYEKGPLGIFRSSLDGKLLSINPAGARLLKFDSPREMIEKVNRTGIGEALYLDAYHRSEVLAEILSCDDWCVYEEQFCCKDGSAIDCYFHMRAVRDTDGRPVELEGFFEDVSERKRIEQELRASETRFRMIVETAAEGIWQVDRGGKTTYVNQRMEQMLYCEPGGMLGMHIYDFMDDEGRQVVAGIMSRRERGFCKTHDFKFIREDGSTLDALVSACPLVDDQGESLGSFAMVTDISERKRTEESLKLSHLMIDGASMGIFRGSEDARILSVNDHWARKLGYTPAELCSMTFFDLDPTLTPEFWREHRKKVTATGSNTFESVHRCKDGAEIPVEITVNLFRYRGQVFSCSFARDISERKQVEEALRESERKYRSIVEHAPFGITHSTKEGKLVSVNPALAAILKYDSAQELQETINRSSIQEVLFPKPAEREPLVKQILSGDSWTVFNNRLRCKDGSIVTCRVHSRRIVDEDGQASGFESYQENITDQVEAEQSLRESEEKFRVLAETSPVAICIFKGEQLVYVNPATERLFGYSAAELLRMKFWDWAHDDCKELIRRLGLARLAGENVPGQYEARYVTKAGEELSVLVSAGKMECQGQPTGIVSYLDITERKRGEELIRSSLEEKEVLLREIHHRVKNNLQVVSSLLYLQSQKLADPELQNHFLESQSRICSMALAHEQLYQSKSLAEVSFRSYVKSLVGQLRQIFQRPGQQIECRTVVGDIFLDIEKVIPCGLLITELLSNAYKHAFADGRSGTITISMEHVRGQLVLSVADDGVGLPAGLNYRQTTTLGLQLVLALVNQLNGTLELEREGGTLFRITFAETGHRDNQPDQQVSDNLF
jgi:PAS domain S-box-containing protein